MRDEAALRLEAINESIRLSEKTGVTVNSMHIKAIRKLSWGLMKKPWPSSTRRGIEGSQ